MPKVEYSFKVQEGKIPKRFEEIALGLIVKAGFFITLRHPIPLDRTRVDINIGEEMPQKSLIKYMKRIGYDFISENPCE